MGWIVNQNQEAPKRKSRERKPKDVMQYIVSLRVTDKEKQVLDRITESSSMSVSEVIREALHFWISKKQRFSHHT